MSDNRNFQKWVKDELLPVINQLGHQLGDEKAANLSLPLNTIPTQSVDKNFMKNKYLSIEKKIRPPFD